MSLSKQYLSSHNHCIVFNVDDLAKALKDSCPDVVFALLMGTSRDGVADLGSDIDIALYVRGKPTLSPYSRVSDVISRFAPGVHCDIGCLNNAEGVYRFESLKGRLLFTRDEEAYLYWPGCGNIIASGLCGHYCTGRGPGACSESDL